MSGLTVVRNSALLGAFAALTAGLIAWTWINTAEDIATAERAFEARQLLEIFPDAVDENALLDGRFELAAETVLLELRETRAGYRVMTGDAVTGVILPATARDGYSGDIRLLIGIRADGSLAGVRVASHRETPGLGDKVDRKKSDWVLSFAGRSLTNPAPSQWAVRKDGGVFDQFTGATVTPRAVVTAVRRTLEYAQLHRATLFLEPTNIATTAEANP